MISDQRKPSFTLPRNFTFHYTDGDLPTTPAPSEANAPSISPPDPPRQPGPYRLRRRRPMRANPMEYFSASNSRDIPIPTIEVSDSPSAPALSQPNTLSQSYGRSRQSPPRTPIPQMDDPNQDTTMDHADVSSQGESISRPSTACSGFSDSSVSSSIESFPSLGESFASPERDTNDARPSHKTAMRATGSPEKLSAPVTHAPPASHVKMPWNEEMDNHLWATYMRYLQDPTHTPFKMLPGTAPPLGVCSRVARESKRTWKHGRPNGPSRAYRLMPWGRAIRADSPDAAGHVNSGSTTPTAVQPQRTHPTWPRSDASTRRRLRELCKRKPTLSAHYNRMLTTRSPSPFPSSSSRGPSVSRDAGVRSPLAHETSFSTRDMTVSLFSTTNAAVSAMSQFTSESATPKPMQSSSFQVPPRTSTHQKSQSLQLNLGLGSSRMGIDSILASPFQPQGNQGHGQPMQAPFLQVRSESTPQLASPVHLTAPAPQSRVSVKHLEGDGQVDGSGEGTVPFPDFDSRYGGITRLRGRNRAVSMGDVNASSRRLSLLFDQSAVPTIANQDQMAAPSTSAPAGLMPPPVFAPLRRLGSPFSEKAPRPFNTFPRNFSVTGLEPTIESQEERVGQMGDEPFDPTPHGM